VKGEIIIRGGGDLASGVALRLHRARLKLIVCEIEKPLSVRRTVSFSEAVYERMTGVEDVIACLAEDINEVKKILSKGQIPVLVDPDCRILDQIEPAVIVDARMKKQEIQDKLKTEAMIIGLGPGFTAGKNCDAVIETNRGHNLGRVIWEGCAEGDTGIPGPVNGITSERVIRAPASGMLQPTVEIGSLVTKGELIAYVDDTEVFSLISGLVRGMAHSGLPVHEGMKIGDIDPREDINLCRFVSEKALAIGGGVLEAILSRPEMPRKLWGI
jgi:xanthine dehydrogenase accessory factor